MSSFCILCDLFYRKKPLYQKFCDMVFLGGDFPFDGDSLGVFLHGSKCLKLSRVCDAPCVNSTKTGSLPPF